MHNKAVSNAARLRLESLESEQKERRLGEKIMGFPPVYLYLPPPPHTP